MPSSEEILYTGFDRQALSKYRCMADSVIDAHALCMLNVACSISVPSRGMMDPLLSRSSMSLAPVADPCICRRVSYTAAHAAEKKAQLRRPRASVERSCLPSTCIARERLPDALLHVISRTSSLFTAKFATAAPQQRSPAPQVTSRRRSKAMQHLLDATEPFAFSGSAMPKHCLTNVAGCAAASYGPNPGRQSSACRRLEVQLGLA